MSQTANEYIKLHAIKSWEPSPDVHCYICRPLFTDHLCGYVQMPTAKPFQEPSYYGFLTYVPVHGGITYAEAPVYGFDCAHVDDTSDYWTLDRVEQETNKLVDYLCLAADGWEQAYLAAQTDEQRAEVVDEYHQRCGLQDGFDIRDNFGAMLNVITGKV